MAPLVAMSNTLLTGIFIGLIFTVTLFITALVISTIRSMVPHITRLAYILIVSSAVISMLDLITQSVFYDLNVSVNIYLPLMTMNCLLVYLLEGEALKVAPNSVITAIAPTASLIFVICLLVGVLREILSRGGILTDLENVSSTGGSGIDLLPAFANMSLFDTAAGTFIITGCIYSVFNLWLKNINS